MTGFVQAFRETWREILARRAAFSILILAVFAYGFYYPLAYQHQTATQLPLAVVDLDQSGLSRTLINDISAAQGVRLVQVGADFKDAEAKLARRDVDAIVYIPAHLERSLLTGAPPGGLAIFVNGAYLVRASAVGAALRTVMTGAVEDALAEPARALGLKTLTPIKIVQRPMFNTREGYGSYVVSGVAILIVHQTLLFGVVMLAAAWRDRRRALPPAAFGGIVAAFSLLGLGATLFYVGFVFWFQDYPRAGDFLGMLFCTALYVPAIVLMALFIGSFFDLPERSTQILASISAPLFFFSGLSWPLSAMPAPLATAVWAIPATPGIRAMVKLNQMGARLDEIRPELAVLAAQIVVYGALAYWRWGRRAQPASSSAIVP